MADLPNPDPNAPICERCKANGVTNPIRVIGQYAEPVSVSQVYWDADGRKHEHYGTPPTQDTYQCDCGASWAGSKQSKLFPCWCGWGQT